MAALPSPMRLGNHDFELTEDHLSRQEIRHLKDKCDELASAALLRLQELFQETSAKGSRLDYYALLCEHHANDPILATLWQQVQTVPEWVDWAQIERGQRVFWRYGFAMLVGFALQGFMGGNAATPSIAEVLVRTGGFDTKVVLRRALETFQGLLQTTRSLEALQPGGEGHISLVRVRLLHAMVRQRILKACDTDPEYFDLHRHGLPINTADDIHTIALFACNPMWLELPSMGLFPAASEMDDYIALFRYSAYVLGVPDHYFANTLLAQLTMESFSVHECQPTETSKVLCHNFIAALKDVPPVNLSAGFIEAACRRINGDGVSDALGVGSPNWLHFASFRGFCWLAQVLVALQRALPRFDNYMIEVQRRLFYAYIVEGTNSRFSLGGASKFEMKYVPRVGKKTTSEFANALVPAFGVLVRPLEVVFLAVFALGCCFWPTVVYLAWRAFTSDT